MDVVLIRFLFILVVGLTCYLIQPFGLPSNLDAAVGLVIGAAIILTHPITRSRHRAIVRRIERRLVEAF